MAAKFALVGLPVAFVPLVRFTLGGLLVLPWALGSGRWRRMLGEDWGRLIVAAFLCVPVNQGFFLNAARLTPTSHVGLIYAACPLVVLGLAAVCGQERLTAQRLMSVLASVLGVAVLGLGNLSGSGPDARNVFVGDLLLIGAVISWGGYLTVVKPLVARHGSLPVLAGTFLVGAVMDLPMALLNSGDWHRIATADARSWWSLLYMSVVATGIGLACQNQAMRRWDASQVAAVGNLSPVLTVVWGVLLLGEPMTPALVVGGLLTFSGIGWMAWQTTAGGARLCRAYGPASPGVAADVPAVVETSGI